MYGGREQWDSDNEMSSNINIADTIMSHKNKLLATLNSTDAISLEELDMMEPENIALYKEWFIKMLKYSDRLQKVIDADFLDAF